MELGAFLEKVVEWLWGWWPLRIVSAWEQGVRVTLGKPDGPLTSTNGLWGTGLHPFWPAAGEIHTSETNVEVSETPTQTITTADGEAVTFALAVAYRITDLRQLYVSVHDHEETLTTQMQAAAGEIAAELYWDPEDETQSGMDLLAELTHKRLDERFAGWGVAIQAISITNLSASPTLRLIGDLPAQSSE